MEFSRILLILTLVKSWELLVSSGEKYPQYLGCFQDHGWPNRAMIYQDALYAESCILSCIGSGYPYAGVEAKDQCFCGYSYNKHGVVAGCKIPCPDNPDLSCGGHWKLAVYSADCPPGLWGQNPPCSKDCGHCLNPKDCLLRTGECVSGKCDQGWRPPLCTVCASGYFGPTCSSLCHCYDNAACNITNGRCPHDKCAYGWEGFNCSAEVPHSLPPHAAPIISVVIAFVVIAAVLIAIIIVFRKKFTCFKKKRRLTVAMVSAPVGYATPIRKFSEKSEEHPGETEKFCPDTSLQYLPDAPLPPEGANRHHSNIYISEPALYATVQKPPKSKLNVASSPADILDDGGYLVPKDIKDKKK